jgi:hypothetical protein
MKKEELKPCSFGDYEFEYWVCEPVRKQIRDFWGCFGRTHKDWLESETAPYNFNGYPKRGQRVMVLKQVDVLGNKLYTAKTGRFIYCWNNIGRIIMDDGTWDMVSSCDKFYVDGRTP